MDGNPGDADDGNNSLWTIFNRVQENIIKGGVKGKVVVGFSTYGEQINSVHVNQTFTGIAIAG